VFSGGTSRLRNGGSAMRNLGESRAFSIEIFRFFHSKFTGFPTTKN
jgi:hypothetical protein